MKRTFLKLLHSTDSKTVLFVLEENCQRSTKLFSASEMWGKVSVCCVRMKVACYNLRPEPNELSLRYIKINQQVGEEECGEISFQHLNGSQGSEKRIGRPLLLWPDREFKRSNLPPNPQLNKAVKIRTPGAKMKSRIDSSPTQWIVLFYCFHNKSELLPLCVAIYLLCHQICGSHCCKYRISILPFLLK